LKKAIKEKLLPKAIGAYLGTLSYIAPTKSGDLALKIFGTPRKGKIRIKEQTYLQNFETGTLRYNELDIRYYKKGNGTCKVLFLHGWESNTARWRHLFTYLEKSDITIYAIDGPAHGGSGGTEFDSLQYAEFINVACTAFMPNVLIGHSIGAGSIAYCMSNIKHHAVDKIILMASPDTFSEIMESYITIIGLNQSGQKALHNAIVRKYHIEPKNYCVSDYVKNIQCAGLVIHDTEDDISPLKNGQRIAKNFKQAQLLITDGYGHSLQNEHVFAAIKTFLDSNR
jgi:pimeloyl-ACP methyl ester carboxylesterase